MTQRLLLAAFAATALFASCEDDDNTDLVETYQPSECSVTGPNTVAGGPFTFTSDGIVDNVSGVSVSGDAPPREAFILVEDDTIRSVFQGSTDDPALAQVDAFDFDGLEPGDYDLHYVAYEGRVLRLAEGERVDAVFGCFAFSDPIDVTVAGCDVTAGELEGGPFAFSVDGDEDNLDGDDVTVTDGEGESSAFLLTSTAGVVYGFYDDLDAVEAVDIDTLTGDTVLLWLATIDGALQGDSIGTTPAQIQGCFALSNPLTILRECRADGGQLTGGPYVVEIDGDSDFVTDLSLSGAEGDNSTYVITEEDGTILGLPGDLNAVAGVDFNAAGEGTCLIWHLSFNGDLGGAEVGANANDLTGCSDLSNPIEVRRNCNADGGRLQGGPFTFDFDDDEDFVSGLTLSGADGEGMTYVVTELDGTILALPSDLDELGDFDFNDASLDTALIWHLSFNGDIEGAEVGANATALEGCSDLSNSVTVFRRCGADAGTLTGGPFAFPLGDDDDDLSSLELSDDVRGDFTTYVITDAEANIIALPSDEDDLDGFDFDDQEDGSYLVWHFASFGEVTGAVVDSNATAIMGCTDLSNSISVTVGGE